MDQRFLVRVAKAVFLLKKVVGLFFLGFVLYSVPALWHDAKLITDGVVTNGQVLRTENVGWLKRGSGRPMNIPIVGYEVGGSSYEARGTFSSASTIANGPREVIYAPSDPAVSRVYSGALTWIDFYIYGFLLLVSLMALFQRTPTAEELQEKLSAGQHRRARQKNSERTSQMEKNSYPSNPRVVRMCRMSSR